MDSFEQREKFYQQISEGKLSLSETIKEMRKIVKMTQPEFAALIKIAPRIIGEIERGEANPTLDTLKKIAKPFGLTVGFIHSQNS